MSLIMPEPDQLTLDNSESIIADLRKISKNVLSEEEEKAVYETDGLSVHRQRPIAVVLPETTKEVSEVLKYCYQNNVKVVPRGAGTGLSGGALPLKDSVLVSLGKFNKILDVDFDNRCVVTQPGVTNLSITGAVQHEGFYYAPDPSSQIACSIGGNISTNAGGVHSLKYGVTTNNVLGIEMVLIDGTIIRLGGKNLDPEGYDLLGIMTGSEGLLAVITEITVRILKKPQSVRAVLIGFNTNDDAGNCVAEIISSGIIPAGMEILQKQAIPEMLKYY